MENLKDKYTTKVEYSINPRFKKRWFRQTILVYDLIEHREGQYWSDLSYGNGLGDFIKFEEDVTLKIFKSLKKAEKLKNKFIKNK